MSEKIKIYHVETQADYDDLMIELEKQGYLWISGDEPTAKNYWFKCQEETVICLNEVIEREMRFSSLGYTKREYPEIPIIKHKAKGVKQMEKLVVPQFVADYMKFNYAGTKPDDWSKASLIRNWKHCINAYGDKNLEKWVKNDSNFITFIKAITTDDYEIEEKKYYWRKKKEFLFDFEDKEKTYLTISYDGRVIFSNNCLSTDYQTKLTETEARQIVSEEDFNKLEKVEITE